jgi:glucose/arabinose dehydrogenase
VLAAALLSACGSGGGAATTSAHGNRTATTSTHGAGAPDVGEARTAGHSRFTRVSLVVPAGNGGGAFSQPRTVTLPRGWTAEVWARVAGARFEAWTPQGDLLVSVPGTGDVWELAPRSRPGDRPAQRLLVSGLDSPQGLAFDHLDGQEVLYVAETDRVDRYQWHNGSVGSRTILAQDLPDGGAHPLKEVAVGPDHTVYVDVGSATNFSPPVGTGPPRAVVLAYSPDGGHRRVIATGIRNGDGLSFAPDGTLWTAVNERDDIAYPFHRPYDGVADAYGRQIQSYVNNHPPDEVARLTPGRNLGWPFCDPDPDLDPGRSGSPTSYANMRFDADVQTNPGGHRLDCSELPRIERGIPAHSAPLGFDFLEHSSLPSPWRDGAVVAVHGSWDREPPRAPAVLWLPWQSARRTLGSAVTLVGGFQSAGGSRWGRPADAVPGPGRALYVSDDTAGAIYRIVPRRAG